MLLITRNIPILKSSVSVIHIATPRLLLKTICTCSDLNSVPLSEYHLTWRFADNRVFADVKARIEK